MKRARRRAAATLTLKEEFSKMRVGWLVDRRSKARPRCRLPPRSTSWLTLKKKKKITTTWGEGIPASPRPPCVADQPTNQHAPAKSFAAQSERGSQLSPNVCWHSQDRCHAATPARSWILLLQPTGGKRNVSLDYRAKPSFEGRKWESKS